MYGALLHELKCKLCKDLTFNKYQVSHSTFNRRKTNWKVFYLGERKKCIQDYERGTILSLYINVYFCSFKAYYPQNLNAGIRENE